MRDYLTPRHKLSVFRSIRACIRACHIHTCWWMCVCPRHPVNHVRPRARDSLYHHRSGADDAGMKCMLRLHVTLVVIAQQVGERRWHGDNPPILPLGTYRCRCRVPATAAPCIGVVPYHGSRAPTKRHLPTLHSAVLPPEHVCDGRHLLVPSAHTVLRVLNMNRKYAYSNESFMNMHTD